MGQENTNAGDDGEIRAEATRRREALLTGTARPVSAFNPDGIPDELRAVARWVLWAWEPKDGGRWSKVPKSTDGRNAAADKPKTWCEFDAALAALRASPGRFDGLGFVLGGGWAGVDLDNCLVTGAAEPAVTEWAWSIARELDSYTEISPTGTGLKVIVKHDLLPALAAVGKRYSYTHEAAEGEAEFIASNKFFTVTGTAMPFCPPLVFENGAALESLVKLYPPGNAKSAAPQPAPARTSPFVVSEDMSAVERCRRYLRPVGASVQGQRGSNAVFKVARIIWNGFALDFADGYPLLQEYNQRAVPPWPEEGSQGLLRKWNEAARQRPGDNKPRGYLLNENRPGYTGTGAKRLRAPARPQQPGNNGASPPAHGGDEKSPAWWEPPADAEKWDDPHRLARLFVNATRAPDGAPTLVQWRDEFFRWCGSAYRPLGGGDLDALLARHARDVFVADLPARRAEAEASESRKPVKLFPVTGRVRSDSRANLAGLVNVPDNGRDAPFWLSGDTATDPRAVVAAPNGLFTLERIARGEGPFAAPTPDLFTPNALPFDAPLGECDPPNVWLEKVKEWFNGDTRSVLGLQEWFGYLLSADTAQHKILMLVGPPRSGKGTILRVLSQLVGAANVAATSFAAMAESFGLQDLIGKRVAVIPDARLSGRTDAAAVTERLLGVSGDDPQTVNRKNLPRVTTRLNVRFVVATNEIPKLADASGALASRFHILALPNSFLGREDKRLDAKLAAELPAVLQWAAKGYVRLRTQGAFTQNDAAAHHHKRLEEQSSPVGAFVRECCRVGPTERVLKAELYAAWCNFCDERAAMAGADNTFGRDLFSACPHVVEANLRTEGNKRARWYRGVGLRPRDEWGGCATSDDTDSAA